MASELMKYVFDHMFEVCIMYSDIMVRHRSQYIIVRLKLFMQHLLDFFIKIQVQENTYTWARNHT